MSARTGTTPRRPAVWRTRGLTLADQLLSSASNVLAVVLVANALDKVAFGRFALAYAVLVAALGVSRSWFGTRLSLIVDKEDVLAEARGVLGSLVILAPVLSGAVWLFASALTRGGPDLLLLFVVALVVLVVCM